MLASWLGSFVIFQRIWTSIAKKPFFVIFQGVRPDPLSPPLDPPMFMTDLEQNYFFEYELAAIPEDRLSGYGAQYTRLPDIQLDSYL